MIAAFGIALLLAACQTGGGQAVYRTGEYTLQGKLCKPEGPGPFPAVIYNHGGLGTIIGGAPEPSCTLLAEAGFVGFSPIRRQTRPLFGHLDDVMAAVDYVKNLAYVDPGRLGIMGFSRGAILTYLAATERRDFKAVIIMGAAVHRALNLSKADAVSAPVLLLVAENDTGSHRTLDRNTHAGTLRLNRALKDAGKDVRLIVYPPYGDDGHMLFFTIEDYWDDVIAFLKRHV
jgi:dipeptidyl aminopeptidase/acylaminoacyl peptidase